MKQLIKDVLEDVAKGQPNLESEAAREVVANLIMAGIKSKGWYLNLNTINDDPKIDVCMHGNSLSSNCSDCDNEYLGDYTPKKNEHNNETTIYTIVENLGWDAKDKKQTIVGKMTKSEYEWVIGLL